MHVTENMGTCTVRTRWQAHMGSVCPGMVGRMDGVAWEESQLQEFKTL